MHRIALLGASGYTGVELTRLVGAHPHVELAVAGSDRWANTTREGVRYVAPDAAADQARTCDLVLLATPAEVSMELVPPLVAAGVRVIDLSGAYRLKLPAAYRIWYRAEHAHPELLSQAVYGLPELDRDAIAKARLVANPGCYATAIQLALAPITHLLDRVAVTAMSGVTGAGRKASEEFSFTEIADDLRAYRVLAHQHVPEIEQRVGLDVAFVPVLAPIRRGILATCHVKITGDVAGAFETAYAGEPFVRVMAADRVNLHDVVGTNRCHLGVAQHGDALVVVAAIDNLVKGAAGQAVQNMNLMLGHPETCGLDRLRSFTP